MVTINSSIELDWTKCEAGYKFSHEVVRKELDRRREGARRRRVWVRPATQSTPGIATASRAVTKIRPFDSQLGLYVVFANYPHTADGIRTFCDSFGLIRHKQSDGEAISLSVDRDLEQQALMKRALTSRNRGDLADAAAIINAAAPTMQPRLHLAPDGRMRMSWQPPTLLAAMWLQFALDLAGGVTIKPCAREGCPKPVIAGPNTGRRSSSRYCSTTCRYAAHYAKRKKKRQAGARRATAATKARRRSRSPARAGR